MSCIINGAKDLFLRCVEMIDQCPYSDELKNDSSAADLGHVSEASQLLMNTGSGLKTGKTLKQDPHHMKSSAGPIDASLMQNDQLRQHQTGISSWVWVDAGNGQGEK